MTRVLVVTDASVCLPTELISALQISVLPISTHLLDESDATGDKDQASAAISDAATETELSAANHPFVTEYLEAIEGPGVESAVVITPAVEFAAMYRNAGLAVSLANCPAVAIDTRTAAAGQALVVLAGAEAALDGADLNEVVKTCQDAASRVVLVASLGTLDPIRRSGPVPADILDQGRKGSHSVFQMLDGVVEPLDTVDSPAEALQRIATAFATTAPQGVDRTIVFHAEATELAERLAELLGGVDFISGFSTAMQVHTGPGVVGAAWIPKAL